MNRTVTFKGAALTLAGTEIAKGARAPQFSVVSMELNPVALSDFKGRIKVITTFPSLDTPVCDLQVREFNKRAASFDKNVVVLAISKDLPFAQARFCAANGIKNVMVLSDYQTASFGTQYGLLIKELQLLTRAVLIVDEQDSIRYVQIVPEITTAPDYDAVMKALAEVCKGRS